MVIWIRTLNKQLKDALYSKSIPIDQLRAIQAKLLAENNKKKKVFNTVMIIVAVVMILNSVYVAKDNGSSMMLWMLCFDVIVLAVIYGIVYAVMFASFNSQFNKAIRDNYPEVADELKL